MSSDAAAAITDVAESTCMTNAAIRWTVERANAPCMARMVEQSIQRQRMRERTVPPNPLNSVESADRSTLCRYVMSTTVNVVALASWMSRRMRRMRSVRRARSVASSTGM